MDNTFEMPDISGSTFVTLEGGAVGKGSGGLIGHLPIDPNQPVVFSTDLPDATVSVNSDGEIIK